MCLIDERITYVIAFRTVNSIYSVPRELHDRAIGSEKEASHGKSYAICRLILRSDESIIVGYQHSLYVASHHGLSRGLLLSAASRRAVPPSNIDCEISRWEICRTSNNLAISRLAVKGFT